MESSKDNDFILETAHTELVTPQTVRNIPGEGVGKPLTSFSSEKAIKGFTILTVTNLWT